MHRYLPFINSTAVFGIKPVTMFNDGRNSKAKQKKPRRHDDEEFMVLLEMVKGGKTSQKYGTTNVSLQASCLSCKRTVVNQP